MSDNRALYIRVVQKLQFLNNNHVKTSKNDYRGGETAPFRAGE
jgi:hypothetical protein